MTELGGYRVHFFFELYNEISFDYRGTRAQRCIWKFDAPSTRNMCRPQSVKNC